MKIKLDFDCNNYIIKKITLEVSMNKKSIFPGQYIQGTGVLNDLPEIISPFGKKAIILASPSVIKNIIPTCGKSIESSGIKIEIFKGECTTEEINRFSQIIDQSESDIVVAMGGGKVIDTAKICADKAKLPVVVVPTIASTDAPCSACAVSYTASGVFETVHYQLRSPSIVLVDNLIIANSPARFLVSGMGDALATWFEAKSCVNSQSPNECNGLSTLSAFHIAKLCYDTLLKYGLLAKIANENKLVTPALVNIIEANILLSGIGFESCGLATAHAVHNGLTELNETHQYYHGEKVAFGVLTGLHLNSENKETIDTVYSFCRSVGLPVTLKDLGINKVTREKMQIVAKKTCSPDQSIHHEAIKVSEEMLVDALLMADAYGKSFL